MPYINCPGCNAASADTAKFCSKCGVPINRQALGNQVAPNNGPGGEYNNLQNQFIPNQGGSYNNQPNQYGPNQGGSYNNQPNQYGPNQGGSYNYQPNSSVGIQYPTQNPTYMAQPNQYRQNSMQQQKKKVPVWIIIVTGILVLSVAAGVYFLFFRGDEDPINGGRDSDIEEDIEEDDEEDIEEDDEIIIYDGPLVGTWHQAEYGEHGNAQYLWSFAENGKFAFLFSAREPPHGGDETDGSVREWFMKGKFRVNGSSIECYDVKYDDYLAWGDEWKYFPDRNPEILAGLLLVTPLKKPDNIDDFSMDFEFDESMILRLVIDLGDFPNQYDMDFTQVS